MTATPASTTRALTWTICCAPPAIWPVWTVRPSSGLVSVDKFANVVFQSALWTSGDLLRVLGLVHYGASMTVTVLIFVKEVMMQEGGASLETIQQILDSAKLGLREELSQMQQKQDHVDERAAQEYAQTSAKAQEWIQTIESALQGSGGSSTPV